eukprot:XP_001693536.1 predicted protein [Chlamydomonas reinhardtii]
MSGSQRDADNSKDDPSYYLREEIRAAREEVRQLDAAVSGAQSFREKATKLLEEAHRALGRLEQALAMSAYSPPELIPIACEIKCVARRGVTLVDVYGKYSTVVKIMTLLMRSYIYGKFDKQIDHLKSLIPAAAPLVGIVLRPNKHDRVNALAYVPPNQGARNGSVCVWWSAGMMLEYYSGNTGSTTGFQIEKTSLNVTAIGVDEAGNVWTGHAKGLVRVRPRQQWEFFWEDKMAFAPNAVKAIAFDEEGRAWVGDDAGRIKVMAFNEGRLESLAVLQRSPALLAKMRGGLEASRGLFGRRNCGNANSGPVRCIFLRGGRAWTSGGRGSTGGWLQLWDAHSFQDVDCYDCCGFGPCHAMAALRWPTDADDNGATGGGTGSLHAPASAHPHHRPTRSDGGRDGAAGGPSSTGLSTSAARPPWRLLTGHENGQLLLWNPSHTALAPLLRIGEPGSPCRGIAAFEDVRLIATGHQNGELHLFLQPSTAGGLPPGSNSASKASFGTLRPRTIIVQAHKSRVDRMVGGPTSCVTSSWLGTIRLWHGADLAAEAHRQGLLAHTASFSSLFTGPQHSPGVDGRAGAGAAAATAGSLQLPSRHTSASVGGHQGSGHTRSASRDSVLEGAAAGTITQQSSGNTTTPAMTAAADAGLAGGPQSSAGAPIGPSAAAMFPHFQTIDRSEISLKRLIGSGAYGKVWLAEWTGVQVAVKELHPNIMRFLAMCLEPPLIVMQYYPHGSLFDLLARAHRGSAKAARELSWGKRLDMLKDVAAGMQYLHSRKPPIIHGDLRSPNLLLDLTIDHDRPRFHVKIADFGLARMLTGAGSVMVSKTTNPRWLAPEVIRNSSVGKAADVFAIIMWELLTWQQPYEDMMSVQVMFSTVTENNRPEVPPEADLPGSPGISLAAYRQLMERCWAADAASRPSFKDLVEGFQSAFAAAGAAPGNIAAAAANAAALGPFGAYAAADAPAPMHPHAASDSGAAQAQAQAPPRLPHVHFAPGPGSGPPTADALASSFSSPPSPMPWDAGGSTFTAPHQVMSPHPQQQQQPQHSASNARGAWVPPPLLASSTVAGAGSPFASAAFSAPFGRAGADDDDDGVAAHEREQGQRHGQEPDEESEPYVRSRSSLTIRPTLHAQQHHQEQDPAEADEDAAIWQEGHP